MYEVTVNNVKENFDALIGMGLKFGGEWHKEPSYLAIQLNLGAVVLKSWTDSKYNVYVQMEHVQPLLLLQDTRARIEYVFSEGLISSKHRANLLIDIAMVEAAATARIK